MSQDVGPDAELRRRCRDSCGEGVLHGEEKMGPDSSSVPLPSGDTSYVSTVGDRCHLLDKKLTFVGGGGGLEGGGSGWER